MVAIALSGSLSRILPIGRVQLQQSPKFRKNLGLLAKAGCRS